jgi:hypothetical protein
MKSQGDDWFVGKVHDLGETLEGLTEGRQLTFLDILDTGAAPKPSSLPETQNPEGGAEDGSDPAPATNAIRT